MRSLPFLKLTNLDRNNISSPVAEQAFEMAIPPDYVLTREKEHSVSVCVEFRSNITFKKTTGYIAWPKSNEPRPFLTSTQLMHAIRLIECDPKVPPMTKALRRVIPGDSFNRVLSVCFVEGRKTQLVRLFAENVQMHDMHYQQAWYLMEKRGFIDHFVLSYDRKLTDPKWKDGVSKDWEKAKKLLGSSGNEIVVP
jgi:hypothetical protein